MSEKKVLSFRVSSDELAALAAKTTPGESPSQAALRLLRIALELPQDSVNATVYTAVNADLETLVNKLVEQRLQFVNERIREVETKLGEC